MNRIGLWITTIAIALLVLSSSMFVVDGRQFAVVYALGEIKEVIDQPGLKFKLPAPLQNVVFLDRRIQSLDSPETRPVFTAEKKSLMIDWLVKWRIKDAKQFIRNNGSGASTTQAEARLSPIVQAALNEEVTKRTVNAMLSTEREKVMQGVMARLSDDAKSFGIEIVDVRIKRVDFAPNIVDSVYRRMESERKRVATELRALGEAEKEKIRAEADRQKELILAEAYRDAEKIKGEADAKATALYSASFGQDPQFAQFYRSLSAYRATFKNRNDVIVMDPSSDFFKAMRGTAGATAPSKR